jgi:hypothetical protein
MLSGNGTSHVRKSGFFAHAQNDVCKDRITYNLQFDFKPSANCFPHCGASALSAL